MIVFDASTLVSAALKTDSRPALALVHAQESDVIAFSKAVEAELIEVLGRHKFASAIPNARRANSIGLLQELAVWFQPAERVTDCRDPSDNKYLELALASDAETIVSSDNDLLILTPWRGVRILRPTEDLETR